MFTPQDTADNNSVTANATINVAPATLVITPANATVPYAAPIPTLTGTVAGLQNNDPITAAYLTTATAGSPVNSYPITASLSDPAGRLGNYKATLNTGTLTITPDTTSTTLVSSANPSVSGQPVTFTAAVAVTSVASSPSGTVEFLDGTAVLVASLPVSFNANDGRYEASYTTAALAAGSHNITAVYSGDGHEQTSTSGVVSQVVSPSGTADHLAVLGQRRPRRSPAMSSAPRSPSPSRTRSATRSASRPSSRSPSPAVPAPSPPPARPASAPVPAASRPSITRPSPCPAPTS